MKYERKEVKILVINCGSSSIKYQIYLMPHKKSLGKGIVERIGEKFGIITQISNKGEFKEKLEIKDHLKAMELISNTIAHKDFGILKNISEISSVGHRVVHGGENYSSSVVIDKDVIKAIKDNSHLAPLHNPQNLVGIDISMANFPDVKHVAVFDTAFHQTLPPAAYLYGLPREFYNKFKIRKYGFHGTSHRFVAASAMTILKRQPENTNIITCHLGNGASVTAVEKGKSIDTSMGFTPLEGLIMGTRCGDIDPAIVFYLLEKGYKATELIKILNKKSGLLGLSEISNDLRDIEKAAEKGNKNAKEALEVYSYKIRKYIGSYAAILIKVDALVLTGGIGQKGIKMRERICRRLENIGIVMDYKLNKEVGGNIGIVSKDYSPTSILVIPTNEELQISIDTYNLLFEISMLERRKRKFEVNL